MASRVINVYVNHYACVQAYILFTKVILGDVWKAENKYNTIEYDNTYYNYIRKGND